MDTMIQDQTASEIRYCAIIQEAWIEAVRNGEPKRAAYYFQRWRALRGLSE